jgi:hypothetical protein
MKITKRDMFKRLIKNEEVVVWATSVITVGGGSGSPHLSIVLKPTFGKIEGTCEYDLEFFPIKKNNEGFRKNGRKERGIICFSTREEAVDYFNTELKKFIDIKTNEIKEAQSYFVA